MSQDLVTYQNQLGQYRDQFARVLPPHMSADKLIRTAYSAATINPKLLACERGSLMRSIMTGAILGLEIDGVTGQAFLVPFKGKVQLMVGYKGYITLAFNSGYILEGRTVRKNDRFNFQYGLTPVLEHEYPSPAASIEQRGEIIASYAVARHTNHNLSSFRVVTLDQIIKARDGSQGYKADKAFSPWTTNFDEMAKKTAIRSHADELPMNVQRAAALEAKHEQTGAPVYLNSTSVPIIDDGQSLTDQSLGDA